MDGVEDQGRAHAQGSDFFSLERHLSGTNQSQERNSSLRCGFGLGGGGDCEGLAAHPTQGLEAGREVCHGLCSTFLVGQGPLQPSY